MEKYLRGGLFRGPRDWLRTNPRVSDLVGLWHRYSGFRVVRKQGSKFSRGGGWYFVEGFSKCFILYHYEPDIRYDYHGFRVVKGGERCNPQ